MRSDRLVTVVVVSLAWASSAVAQVQFMGKVWAPRTPEAADKMPVSTGMAEDYFAPNRPGDGPDVQPLTNIRCYASLDGPGS
jgi:hypothetical protein